VLVPGRVVDLGSLASDPLPPGWSRSPRRRRAVPGFLIARTETTRRVWHGLAEGAEAQAGPSWHASDNVPVEQVSWIDAARWCEATGLCLPTEDMWETACQAGMDGVAATIQDHAWHAPSPGDDIHDVATRKPDAIGLFDILGNVSEWTADRWLDDGGQPEDESGSSEDDLRPYRGGSAFDAEEECSCSLRRASRASNRHEGHLGFRAAHMLE
jgi:formylglycine-generating enzyme required for sulfatase activity